MPSVTRAPREGSYLPHSDDPALGAVLRLVKAMPLLAAGQTLETLALDLGCGSASSFVSMFKRMLGATPDEPRRGAARVVEPKPY